jgi:hypothetical protein
LESNKEKSVVLPTEFTHIGIVQTLVSDRPFLLLHERPVAERGALRNGYVRPVKLPNALSPDWLDSDEFGEEFRSWLQTVNLHKHVFLGYSSQATDVAMLILRFLTETLKLLVYDWHDFHTGDSIWDSIERAENLTTCGIFLFMADDTLTTAKSKQFAPRDNVVYEAGYFAGAKGRRRSLIIREEGAKLPTDLGGILYLSLDNRKSIAKSETKLGDNISRMLNPPPL